MGTHLLRRNVPDRNALPAGIGLEAIEELVPGGNIENKLFLGAFLRALRQERPGASPFCIQREGHGNPDQPLRLSCKTKQQALGHGIYFIAVHALRRDEPDQNRLA
jgi:hypothetical protein